MKLEPQLLPEFADEAAAEKRLRRMRMIPLLLLILMAVLFVVSLTVEAGWARWLEAFAEAAMVGALADWFAVTALFRHPLGIPIPHTAIVPNRKDEIGENLARFVARHFLTREVLKTHWHGLKPGHRLAEWLQQVNVRKELAQYTLAMLHWGMQAVGEAPVQAFLKRLFAEPMTADRLGQWAGRGLHTLIEQDRHQPVVTVLLEFLAGALSRQQYMIRQRIKQGSPWWMPGFVDDTIAKQMLARVETLLLMMSADEKHSLRRAFNIQLHRLARELEQGKHNRDLMQWWEGMSNQPALHDYLLAIWQRLGREIEQQAADKDGDWQQEIQDWLAHLAEALAEDEAMLDRLDEWFSDALVEIINTHRDEVSKLISDTVAAWDARETSHRIELQIGPDLQFIRINGTLVGGVIGLILYAVAHYLF